MPLTYFHVFLIQRRVAAAMAIRRRHLNGLLSTAQLGVQRRIAVALSVNRWRF
jgi:hypothetical protein